MHATTNVVVSKMDATEGAVSTKYRTITVSGRSPLQDISNEGHYYKKLSIKGTFNDDLILK